MTQTETSRPRSAASCFSRIAAASPAGPAPTITTSNSIASRWGASIADPASRFVGLPEHRPLRGSLSAGRDDSLMRWVDRMD